ncbi:hypothetical protein N8I77_012266 [Diaporthe amygdali]|uniref:Uncharacterized protein n=1 Tax=Phomopsis amygdali TaxID=1214568 RepID=A0AAD9S3P7_PHOAM|nr:hypothetical protein N8I77_012266 [Diaporthe amygdali]
MRRLPILREDEIALFCLRTYYSSKYRRHSIWIRVRIQFDVIMAKHCGQGGLKLECSKTMEKGLAIIPTSTPRVFGSKFRGLYLRDGMVMGLTSIQGKFEHHCRTA